MTIANNCSLQFRFKLTIAMLLDFGGCFIMEKGCKALFADLEPSELITRGRARREKRRELEADEAFALNRAALTNGSALEKKSL